MSLDGWIVLNVGCGCRARTLMLMLLLCRMSSDNATAESPLVKIEQFLDKIGESTRPRPTHPLAGGAAPLLTPIYALLRFFSTPAMVHPVTGFRAVQLCSPFVNSLALQS